MWEKFCSVQEKEGLPDDGSEQLLFASDTQERKSISHLVHTYKVWYDQRLEFRNLQKKENIWRLNLLILKEPLI